MPMTKEGQPRTDDEEGLTEEIELFCASYERNRAAMDPLAER